VIYKYLKDVKEYLHDPVSVQRTSQAVVCDDVPIPPIGDGEVVGFRYWGLNDFGQLLSGVKDYGWKVFNVADEVPGRRNSNGFYAYRVTPNVLASGKLYSGNLYFGGGICGLVSLSGRVVEHTDGVLRAECAKVRCIWYVYPPGPCSEVCRVVGLLMHNYPAVPLYVCTPKGLARVLVVLAMRELMLER